VKRLLCLVLVLVGCGLGCGLGCGKAAPAVSDCTPGKEKDCRPPMATPVLGGKALTDADLGGKVVMVNFWATWCAPCAGELPGLDAVYRKHQGDGYVAYGVLVADKATDDEVLKFAADHKVSYPIIRGTPEFEQPFGLGDGLPATYLYDRHGRLRAHWEGAVKEKALEDKVSALLAE
jgi:thiol-disulfide isomerase/thioredoxin